MTALHNYQSEAFATLVRDQYAIAEFPYGSGKSLIALEWAKHHYLRASFPNAQPDPVMPGYFTAGDPPTVAPMRVPIPAIIFCGNRNVPTWQQQIERHAPSWHHVTIDDYAAALANTPLTPRRDNLRNDPHLLQILDTVILCPYHRAHKHRHLLASLRPACYIADEGTLIKNPAAQQTIATLRIVQEHNNRNIPRLVLSGNIAPQSPLNFWSQFEFAYGHRQHHHGTQPFDNPLGITYYQFLRKWFLKTDYQYVLRHELTEQFYTLVRRNVLNFTESQLSEFRKHVGVSNVEYQTIHYNPSPTQQQYLDQLNSQWALPGPQTAGTDRQLEYSHIMTVMQKRRQLCSGFYYTPTKSYVDTGNASRPQRDFTSARDNNVVHLPGLNPKMRAVADYIVDAFANGVRRIVCWVVYREEVPLLVNAIRATTLTPPELPYTFDLIDDPTPENLAIFDNVKANPEPIAIIMPISRARGINDLVSANIGIFVSNEYSQELRDQAQARIDRLGQKHHTVTHIDVVSPNSIDAEIAAILQARRFTHYTIPNIIKNLPCPPQQKST